MSTDRNNGIGQRTQLPAYPHPRIALFSQGERGRRCIDRLHADGHRVIAVVSQDTSDSTHSVCMSIGAPEYQLARDETLSAPPLIQFLRGNSPDLMIMAGFDRIVPTTLLSLPPIGTLNLHAGRLPEYRGASVMQWQIINGEVEGGCTIHMVDGRIDTGPIIAQETFPIGPNMTGGELVTRTLEIFPRLLADVLRDIQAGRATLIPQAEERATYYCQRLPQDNLIRWEVMTAAQVHNLVRAIGGRSLPPAFTYFEGHPVGIRTTSLPERRLIGAPGRVLFTSSDGAFVMCADRAIRVDRADIRLYRGLQFVSYA